MDSISLYNLNVFELNYYLGLTENYQIYYTIREYSRVYSLVERLRDFYNRNLGQQVW